MMRWIVVFAAVLAASGCSSNSSFTLNPFKKPKSPDSEVLSQAEWTRLKRDNALRIQGEGIPAAGPDATTRPVEGVQGFFEFAKFVFWTLPKRTIEFYLGYSPGRYARMMEDDQSADARRTGILKLVTEYDYARKEPYTKRYWQIAQGDPDYLVRVAAIRALNRSRDRTVVPVAIAALDHPNPMIRLEAAKALANVPDERAVPALLKHLNTVVEVRLEGGRTEQQVESRDVRLACADALRNYPTRDVANALVNVLRDKMFEVSWQARKSLNLMTGHDYKYDIDKWKDFLAKDPQPFG